MDSFQDRLLWFDDFHGDQVQDEWRVNTTGSIVVVDQQTGGIIRSTTGAVTGNTSIIDWQDIRSLLVIKRGSVEFRIKLNQTASVAIRFGLHFDWNNYIHFLYSGAGNWSIICRDNAVSSAPNSGIAPDTDYHIYRIECHTHGSNHVHFYIDGVQTANSPITTNIPDDATDYLQPYLYIITNEDLAKSMDVDYCYIRQDR